MLAPGWKCNKRIALPFNDAPQTLFPFNGSLLRLPVCCWMAAVFSSGERLQFLHLLVTLSAIRRNSPTSPAATRVNAAVAPIVRRSNSPTLTDTKKAAAEIITNATTAREASTAMGNITIGKISSHRDLLPLGAASSAIAAPASTPGREGNAKPPRCQARVTLGDTPTNKLLPTAFLKAAAAEANESENGPPPRFCSRSCMSPASNPMR